MRSRSNKITGLAAPYLIWVVGFTVIPLLVICRYAFTGEEGGFTLENVLAVFDPIHLKALLFSLEIAFFSTVFCILLSYPLVLAMGRLHFKKNRFMLFILILPMWMNFILRILAWQMILSENGILNALLGFFGLGPVHVANTGMAVMIGVVYDYLPYMVLPIFNAVAEIGEDVIESARDLGGRKWDVFCRVIFPLSLPGLMSGIVMVFVPSMTEFVIADILGGGKLALVGNIIEQEFNRSANWHLGSGLSVMLMIFMLITMAFTIKGGSEEEWTSV